MCSLIGISSNNTVEVKNLSEFRHHNSTDLRLNYAKHLQILLSNFANASLTSQSKTLKNFPEVKTPTH